jgi:Ca-activated chloride channel family protein
MVTHALIAATAMALACAGEWLHARRVARAAHLAFPIHARPRAWTCLAPTLRVLGLGLAAFGALVLLSFEPAGLSAPRSARYSKQLLLCLDVSPSMHVPDAGPDVPRVPRGEWAAQVIRPLLDSLDPHDSRISLIAFYDTSKPILIDTTDKDVVYNLMDGIRLELAFKGGETDLQAGVNGALAHARPWAKGSTTLVVISDGDSDAGLGSVAPRPASIADVLVVGVGDASSISQINGRSTRQDAHSLRALASRLDGAYIDCNQLPLTPNVMGDLLMRSPEALTPALERTIGVACVGLGGSFVGLVPFALLAFGRPRAARRAAEIKKGALA